MTVIWPMFQIRLIDEQESLSCEHHQLQYSAAELFHLESQVQMRPADPDSPVQLAGKEEFVEDRGT